MVVAVGCPLSVGVVGVVCGIWSFLVVGYSLGLTCELFVGLRVTSCLPSSGSGFGPAGSRLPSSSGVC